MTEVPPPVPRTALPLLCWLDIETTGLDETKDRLLEVGLILTGWDLVPLAERSWLVHLPREVEVSDFIAKMHGPVADGGSGLLDGCRARSPLDDEEHVEALILRWLATHGVTDASKPMLAGRNAHFDRRWIRRHLPGLEARLSHRNLDVTTLRLAMGEWGGVAVEKDATAGAHRSLADLHVDLAVARRFRDVLCQGQGAR